MFCGKCGKQLEDDEVVCPWCGEATGVEVGEKRYSQQPENGGYEGVKILVSMESKSF